MIFDMGNEVVVVGPDRYGNDTDKMKFTIVMMWSDDGKTFYSDRYSPWYPANSLRLVNEKPLSPMQVTCTYDPVDCECRAIQVSCPCGRKAEIALPEKSEWKEVPDGLKIGDWVKVIGPCALSYGTRSDDPTIFEIKSIFENGLCNGDMCRPSYPATSLRKLTPEEIEQHMNPGKPTYEYPITPAKDFDDLTLRDIARMSGICKNEYGVWISTLIGRAHKNEERLSAIEKRLAFVEQFQRDQDDLIGRAIRDGVAEIWRKA